MDHALSQRAALAMNAQSYVNLSADESQAYIDAVAKADDFDSLPQKWKDFILQCEKEEEKYIPAYQDFE